MFEINDKVQALDDDFEGVVISVKDDEIGVQGVDGFVLYFRKSELVPVITGSVKKELGYVPQEIVSQKSEKTSRKRNRIKPKERNSPSLEVDLHIHKLTDRDRDMSSYDMLNLQLETAKRQLNFAISKRIQKIVFIHGVGAGVLREELYTLFRRYENVKYYDADFQKYGAGATEVYIYQNVKSS